MLEGWCSQHSPHPCRWVGVVVVVNTPDSLPLWTRICGVGPHASQIPRALSPSWPADLALGAGLHPCSSLLPKTLLHQVQPACLILSALFQRHPASTAIPSRAAAGNLSRQWAGVVTGSFHHPFYGSQWGPSKGHEQMPRPCENYGHGECRWHGSVRSTSPTRNISPPSGHHPNPERPIHPWAMAGLLGLHLDSPGHSPRAASHQMRCPNPWWAGSGIPSPEGRVF